MREASTAEKSRLKVEQLYMLTPKSLVPRLHKK